MALEPINGGRAPVLVHANLAHPACLGQLSHAIGGC